MSVFISITAEHAALTLTARTQIHASRARLWNACDEANQRRGFARALCGVDARPIVHRIGDTDDVMVADWPPPVIDRCPDCARLTGIGGRLRKGSRHWQNLIPEPVTPPMQRDVCAEVDGSGLIRLVGIPGGAA